VTAVQPGEVVQDLVGLAGTASRDTEALRPEIFDELARTQRGSGNEIQLTDAIAKRVPHGEVIVRRFSGTRFDCGSKAGFLAANVALGRRQGLIE